MAYLTTEAGAAGGIHVGTTAPEDTNLLWIDPSDETEGGLPSGTNIGDILVWNGTSWVAQQPSRLPAGYKEVEWIQATGEQYIITGILAKPTSRIVADVTFEEFWGETQSMLSGTADGSRGILFGKDERGFVSMVTNNYTWNIYGGGDNNRHLWDIQSGSQKIDNVEMSTSVITSAFSQGYDFYIFGRHRNVAPINDTMVNGKLYSYKIYDGNILIADFVPCYNSGGTIGLFDVVNFKFYTNAGTGTFIKGPDV